jgi:hypothetical protein
MRRSALASLGALIATLALCVATAGAQTAQTADSFVESIGVNVHLGYYGTPYQDRFEAVEKRLEELGVRHVRSRLYPEAPNIDQALNDLAGDGIDSTLILGDPSEDPSALEAMLSTLKTTLAGSVDAVEGPNEYSTSGDAEWKTNLTAYQQRLYEGIKDDPALSSLPVIGPSIVHGDQPELGDISNLLDYGNVHSYPEGNPPEYRMGAIVERAAYNSGLKPIVATETGYTNAINWMPTGPGENKPVPEEAAAVYLPRLFFEYFIRHIARTFSYELVDEHSNPGLDEREEHFGLLRNDLSPKPAFVALRNTIQILEDPGPAFSPGSLDYSLSEGGAPLHSVLLQKRDGRFYLALWRLESVWNPDEREALVGAVEPVTISVKPGIQAYAAYSPNVSVEPVASASEPTGSVTVDIGPEVTIVELEPGSPMPPISPIAAPLFPPPNLRPAEHCVVPKLKGRTLRGSRKRSRAVNCRIGRVVKLLGVRSRRVVRQSPRPGSVLAPDAKIKVTLGS